MEKWWNKLGIIGKLKGNEIKQKRNEWWKRANVGERPWADIIV